MTVMRTYDMVPILAPLNIRSWNSVWNI